MTQTTEPQVSWSQDKMIEVKLNEPDDFLKVRETLTRIGVEIGKKRNFTNPAISFISRVNITSYTLRSYLLSMQIRQSYC